MRSRFMQSLVALGIVAAMTVGGTAVAMASADGSNSVAVHTKKMKKIASDSKAAELRAGLTALLQEHVYLAGIATGTALSGGDLTPPAQALDQNSVALGDAIASIYGRAAGDQFTELWRTHITFFVNYTTARATNDQAGIDQATADLDGYRSDFGAFIASANPNLPKEAIADALIPHIQSLFDAIDAQAAKDPSQFALLVTAASHMPMTAKVLAAGIVKQFPKKFRG